MILGSEWLPEVFRNKVFSDEESVRTGDITTDKTIPFLRKRSFQEFQRGPEAVIKFPNMCLIVVHAKEYRRFEFGVILDHHNPRIDTGYRVEEVIIIAIDIDGQQIDLLMADIGPDRLIYVVFGDERLNNL